MEELINLYKTNEKFKSYVDKYAMSHALIIMDALNHTAVRQYAEYIKNEKEEELIDVESE